MSRRNRREEMILAALLAHRTVREAAEAAGVTERTVYDYLSKSTFKARYQAARDDIVRGAANSLFERMSEAADVITAIMRDSAAPHRDRRAAACVILEYGVKYTNTLDILERMKAIEDKINRIEDEDCR